MTTPVISQLSSSLDLEWTEGDPISLTWIVKGVDWSGTYESQVRRDYRTSSPVLLTLTVSATFDGVDTTFVVTASEVNSLLLTSSTAGYVWDMQEVDGPTRFTGKVTVAPQVTR